MAETIESKEPKSIEALVYRLVGNYLTRKLDAKYGLKWESAKGSAGGEKDYSEKKEKLAKDAFYAIRSRTGVDFVDYFSTTLCSVPQHVGEEGYATLSRALLDRPDTLRTLTLLALSARS